MHGVGESRLVVRPLAKGDEAELLRIHRTPEVALWWEEPEEGFPWSDEPESTRFTIEVDAKVAGMIQFDEEQTPKYSHATIDLFLDPALHGQGIDRGSQAPRRPSDRGARSPPRHDRPGRGQQGGDPLL